MISLEGVEMIKRILAIVKNYLTRKKIFINFSSINYGQVLHGKRIVVTGGSRGLGYAIAQKFVNEGAGVLITGRNENTIKEAQKKIGGLCKGIVHDMTDIEHMDEFIVEAERLLGGTIDILVCNAGISLHESSILGVTQEGFETQFKTNLEGAFFLAKSFLNRIGSGDEYVDKSILFISSERGKQCDDVPYGLTKVALNSLTQGISRRFYRRGIRCNALAPGITASDMTNVRTDDDLYTDRIASGRYFVPEEVAEVAMFLVSDASKCISGEIITCDGGEFISSYIK